ncbi:MAG: hypothetical protein KKA62_04050 [Nanoarchaeota archaeon]|nr:hypothetical protein [Nanoarchaeota archaeon]MBU1644001.1 hypothetical protein [Nanoarchaeota archaeon]MBU1977096.1 hypothetical protein [Nanoarchaeota archaeon]
MRSTLATLLILFSLSYVPRTFMVQDISIPCLQQISLEEQDKTENRTENKAESLQDLANELYAKMKKNDDILVLFFESYGTKQHGFYVEKNLPGDRKHLIFHADDQLNGKTAVLKVGGDFKSIEKVVLKKLEGGRVVKEAAVNLDDKDLLLLYRRMLEASVKYVDKVEIIRYPPTIGNFAKYNGFIKDDEFVSSLENLISKTGI